MKDYSNKNLHELEIPSKCKELKANYNSLQSLCLIPETLEKLELTHNKIAMIDYINQNNNLKYLNLSYNRLISVEGIPNLSKLQILDISYNFLGTEQLQVLKNLQHLKSLNISHNHCRGSEVLLIFSELSRLHELNVSFNDFLN